MSSNINRTYCIHWVMISYLYYIFVIIGGSEGFSVPAVFTLGIVIYIAANILTG